MRERAPDELWTKRALKALCLCVSVLSFLSGCRSYTIVQRSIFANEDGDRVTVDYGRSEKDHVNTFISPATNKEMEFRSKLMVNVEFDEDVAGWLWVDGSGTKTNRIELAGRRITAWQCMNFLPQGTMYESDDGEWKVLVNGFACFVYQRTDEEPPRYAELFGGILCDSPELDVKKDDKWRDVTHRGKREYKKPAPVKAK